MPVKEKAATMTTGPNDASPADQNVVPLNASRSPATGSMADGSDDEPSQPKQAQSARHMVLWSRLFAGMLAVSWLIAWPIGSTMSWIESTGTFGIRLGYSAEMLIMAITSIALVLFLGWALAAGLRMEATARSLTRALASAADSRTHPQTGLTRQQLGALNTEMDQMLKRLAEAESLIRQQVKAINAAGSAIETGAVKSTDRLERERKALMELTEEMNREAEGFATKIAERSELSATEAANVEKRIDEKESELAAQLQRLEAVSAKSLDRFETMASAMENRGDELSTVNAEASERQTAIAAQIEENARRIASAQEELAEQSTRLESLIKDQRKRADRLAKVVTDQTHRLAAPQTPAIPAPAPTPAAKSATPAVTPAREARQAMAWKDILSKADRDIPSTSKAASTNARSTNPNVAPAPIKALKPAEAPKPAAKMAPAAAPPAPTTPKTISIHDPMPPAMDHLINRLHNFSLVVQTQLFGAPSHEELMRFEAGERQIFSKALTSGNTDDLRQSITDEVARNAIFRERVDEYLKDFDSVLEPLSLEDGGEEAIESYLTSSIGRLYIVTGSAVDHFA